jgi:hypothetical protein
MIIIASAGAFVAGYLLRGVWERKRKEKALRKLTRRDIYATPDFTATPMKRPGK